jgi:hypothetical protein
MAENVDKSQQVADLMRRAEGFMTDAEFRDETEMKQIRYLQAMSHALIAIGLQNEMIIELLKSQAEYSDLSGS